MRPARTTRQIVPVLVLVAVAASVTGSSMFAARAIDDWPQWRGPRRDGLSAETNLLTSWPPTGPTRLWSATGLGAGFSSVAISAGKIFTMGDRPGGQFVMALDGLTGKQLWATRVGGR